MITIAGIILFSSLLFLIVIYHMSHNRKDHQAMKQTVHGEILAIGTGEIDIEEDVIRSRGVHHHPHSHIKVEFGPVEEGCSPCDPCASDNDELDWGIIVRETADHGHHHESREHIVLCIKWSVACPRTIKWSIKIPS